MRKRLFSAIACILVVLMMFTPICQSANEGEETTGTPAGWSDDIRLTNSTSYSGYSEISGVNDTIYVVWREDWQLYFKRSDNNGLNWSTGIQISTTSPWINPHARIGVFNNYIHVIWEGGDREVYYLRSQDYGDNWDPEICISDDDGIRSMYPVIAVNGSNLHVIWSDEKNGGIEEIYYLNSTDNGSNWNTQTRLTNNPTDDSAAAIAILENSIHITWTRRFPLPEVMYMKSIDNGVTWNPESQLTPDDGSVSIPSDIAVWNNYVHLSYDEHIGGYYETYYFNSSDEGETWSPSRQISDPVYLSSSSRLAVHENNIYLVWTDAKDLYGTVPTEIYYTTSTNSGLTWKNNTRLTIAENISGVPSIILINGMIHISWMDSRDDTTGTDTEIYYKRYPDFPPYPSYNITLSKGWNLISVPLYQYNESINQVLQSIDGKWDYIQAYNALDSDHWKTNAKFKPTSLNDFHLLEHKMGFWINITEPDVNLTVEGPIPGSTSISLYAGWNLVGYPSLIEKNISDALAGTGYDMPVEGFNASAPYRISPLADSYMMKPGEGYWVHVVADSVWVVDW